MKILVTNDDGIYAPGLQYLSDAMKAIGEIAVVAPDRNRSGSSSALTLDRPLRATEIAPNRYSVQGTPTDCVHLATTGLFVDPPRLVISGINAGSNLGDDVFYSGTVAAAIEGRVMGFPAIAISLAGKHEHFDTAAIVAQKIVKKLITNPFPSDTILNINVPDLPINEIRGYEVTRLGTRHAAEPVIRQMDPRGNLVYWIGLPGLEQDAGPGTDFHAIHSNIVSITPLQLDITNYKTFTQVASWINDLS
jgi:5'-nucleotidase